MSNWAEIDKMTKAQLVEELEAAWDDLVKVREALEAEATRRGWCREYDLFAIRLTRKLSRQWFAARTSAATQTNGYMDLVITTPIPDGSEPRHVISRVSELLQGRNARERGIVTDNTWVSTWATGE